MKWIFNFFNFHSPSEVGQLSRGCSKQNSDSFFRSIFTPCWLKCLVFFRKMEQRTLVVMAAMGLLNICFGLVDSIQVTFIFFGDLLNIVHISTYFISFIYTYFTYILLIISIYFIYKSMRGILFSGTLLPWRGHKERSHCLSIWTKSVFFFSSEMV